MVQWQRALTHGLASKKEMQRKPNFKFAESSTLRFAVSSGRIAIVL